jgi:type II restriction enzyme
MKAKDILQFYEAYYARYGQAVYLHFNDILIDAKTQHQHDIDVFNAQLPENVKKKDFEQSWRSIKGASLENLVFKLLTDVFEQTPIKIIKGSGIKTLGSSLRPVYDALLVDYDDLGKHIPDSDLIVYTESPPRLVAILSIKTSLRERIAQVAYWKSKVTVPYLFITTDNDGDFLQLVVKKPRAIAETDSDGVYLLTEQPFFKKREDKVKAFHHLIDDLKKLAEG